MSGKLGTRKDRTNFVQFSRSPLQVDETKQWDPLEDFDEAEFSYVDLDLTEIREIGAESRSLCEHYGVAPTISADGKSEGMEVGDDRVDWTLDSARGAATLVVQSSVLKMGTSWKDTNLSNRIWNFCEVSGSVPAGKEESFNFCRKVGDFSNLGFTDVPPLRILMDVMKGDRAHSSTTSGKVSMLASRMRTPRSEHLPVWNLASYLQDGFLRTSRSSEPKYLPQIMGGSGCRAAFQQPDNLYLSVLAYRGGGYTRIYGTATEELRQCLDHLERGQATMPVLCTRLRDRQEYLHGTYAEKVFVPTSTMMSREIGILPTALVRASGGSNRYSAFENRLVRTKRVVDAAGAEREYAHTVRLRAQLLDVVNPVPITDACLSSIRRTGRARFWDALSANSAFANLLARTATLKDVKALTNEDFLVVNTGVTAFRKWNADWLFNGGKSGDFSIDDLTTVRDLYVRSEVSEEETLKVGGLVLTPFVGNTPRRVVTRAKVGLYQINESMEEWADDLLGRLTQLRDEKGTPLTAEEAHTVYEQNTEWVNDDTALIGRCLRETQSLHYRSSRVCLISADKRLANQMANTCQTLVCLVHPTDYITWSVGIARSIQDPLTPDELEPYLERRGREDPIRYVYMDWGSIASHSANVETDDNNLHRIRRRKVVNYSTTQEGKRAVTYTLQNMEPVGKVPYRHYHPVSRPKRFRFGSGSESLSIQTRRNASERHSSWRSDQESMGRRPNRTGWSASASSQGGRSPSLRAIPGAWPG